MDQSGEAAPTAPQARVVIRLDGPVPASALESVLEEHGVSAEPVSDDRVAERGIDWLADTQNVVTTIVAAGGTAAIGAAIAAFRKRFPKAKVKVESGDVSDDGGPDDGGFLD